ncbi:MAG: PilZ domain-containing protein [Gemmataceae bacterium]|nr:PilZ domain-containing protein [Gemmataceae bacterium]
MLTPPSTDPATSDRRSAPRLQPAFRTICRLDRHGPAGMPCIGLVWNLSETGLSMLMADPPSPGAEFSAELLPEEGGNGLPVNLRIVHVRPSSTGDYILGARFENRLQPEALQMFLTSNVSDSSREEIEGSPNWMPPKKG